MHVFKPGDLIITKSHLCNQQVNDADNVNESSVMCIHSNMIGMVLSHGVSPRYGRGYYTVLFGEGRILNIWETMSIKKYDGEPLTTK